MVSGARDAESAAKRRGEGANSAEIMDTWEHPALLAFQKTKWIIWRRGVAKKCHEPICDCNDEELHYFMIMRTGKIRIV